MQHIICNRNVFTNFLPCSHAFFPNNETCLVTCTVLLSCATWLYVLFNPPLNQDTSANIHLFTKAMPLLPSGLYREVICFHQELVPTHLINFRVTKSRFCPICTFFRREFQSSHE